MNRLYKFLGVVSRMVFDVLLSAAIVIIVLWAVLYFNTDKCNAETIKINKENAVVLTGVVNYKSFVDLEFKMFVLRNKYPNKKLYIVFNSQGGSTKVSNLYRKAIKRYSFRCIGYRALSAAFYMLATCEYRYATRNAELMMHLVKAYIPFLGRIPAGESIQRSYFSPIAKLMGISFDELYVMLLKNGDWFFTPHFALYYNLIDGIIDLEVE